MQGAALVAAAMLFLARFVCEYRAPRVGSATTRTSSRHAHGTSPIDKVKSPRSGKATTPMSSRPATEGSEDPGATMLITHRVRAEKHAEYERWLDEIEPLCRTWPGHLDWHILRPVKGLPETFTVVIRFDTRAHLLQWMRSTERARLLEKVRPLFVAPDDVQVTTGLDFWFVRAESNAKVPVRWKQYLMTWSAIYPLVLGVPLAVAPVLGKLGVPDTLPLHTLVVTGVVVFLMVYVVMPRYTRLMERWLFR